MRMKILIQKGKKNKNENENENGKEWKEDTGKYLGIEEEYKK
jgi:hypothetical protein